MGNRQTDKWINFDFSILKQNYVGFCDQAWYTYL